MVCGPLLGKSHLPALPEDAAKGEGMNKKWKIDVLLDAAKRAANRLDQEKVIIHELEEAVELFDPSWAAFVRPRPKVPVTVKKA